MVKSLEDQIDGYYGKRASEPPSWTLEQLVEAERAKVEAVKEYGYLPIANLWLGPLITKWMFEPQTPKELTQEEKDALIKEFAELNQWLMKWSEEHPGML